MPVLSMSTEEYFAALREGKYLLFLEWPVFVSNKNTGSDDLPEDLAVAWLEYGFFDADIHMLALLYAVHESRCDPQEVSCFLNVDSFALTTIINAFYIASSFKKNGLDKSILSLKNHNKDFKSFIGTHVVNKEFHSALIEVQKEFLVILSMVKEEDISTTRVRLKEIVVKLSQVNRYINSLGVQMNMDFRNQIVVGNTVFTDGLVSIRLVQAQNLFTYLRQQFSFNEEVSLQTAEFVNSIRSYYPSEEEKEFLNDIAPLTLLQRTQENTLVAVRRVLKFFISLDEEPSSDVHSEMGVPNIM